MQYEQISLENIQAGQLVEQVNAALIRIARDVVRRPRLSKGRKVTIEIEITPKIDDVSGRNYPSIDWDVAWKVPGQAGMTTRAFVEGDKVVINTNDPAGIAPDQPTILDDLDEEPDARRVQTQGGARVIVPDR
jgi:cell division septation protein DedD